MTRSRDKRVSPGERDQPPHGSLSMQAPWQRGGSACNWRKGESRTSSLGQFNSSRSMKDPPSQDGIFFWTRLDYNDSEACWNVSQLFELLVGTVLGGYGIPNCGGGGAAARSSLDQGSPESKSLSYAVLREIVLRMDAMPWYRRQRQWKVASSDEGPQNDALDHGAISALRLVGGLLAEGCRMYPGKGMANSFRSRSSSFLRGGEPSGHSKRQGAAPLENCKLPT